MRFSNSYRITRAGHTFSSARDENCAQQTEQTSDVVRKVHSHILLLSVMGACAIHALCSGLSFYHLSLALGGRMSVRISREMFGRTIAV